LPDSLLTAPDVAADVELGKSVSMAMMLVIETLMVGSSERWNALWHLMNTSDTPREVYIQYTVGCQPGTTAQNSRAVTPFFLDVTGCGNSTYDVPGDGGPGSIHTQARTWSAPWNGYLVRTGGHLHGGGIDIAIRDDADGLECRMVAKYEHSHPTVHRLPSRPARRTSRSGPARHSR
jgi:hypothetical protein